MRKSRIDYEKVERHHMAALREAFNNASEEMKNEMLYFKAIHKWVDDYAFFMAYRDYNSKKPLWEMDEELRRRERKAMDKYRRLLSKGINFYIFVQYLFFKQWVHLKAYAHEHNVEFIGDMPIYVSLNSADVWSNPRLFKLDDNLNPTGVAGCPPDPYSDDGQLWVNPLYNWDYHREKEYGWWIARIRDSLEMVDVLRIDHFRAFDRYWEVPPHEETAKNGTWKDGPKMELFDAINKQIPNARIIAEDLGKIDDGVRNLLKATGYPGMKVMIFGLTQENEHTPKNWPENCIGYTSTHDSEPIRVAIENLSKENYAELEKELKINPLIETVSISAIKAAYASKARIVIVPIADVLSLGAEARINIPGLVLPENWSWRAEKNMFTPELAKMLSLLVESYK